MATSGSVDCHSNGVRLPIGKLFEQILKLGEEYADAEHGYTLLNEKTLFEESKIFMTAEKIEDPDGPLSALVEIARLVAVQFDACKEYDDEEGDLDPDSDSDSISSSELSVDLNYSDSDDAADAEFIQRILDEEALKEYEELSSEDFSDDSSDERPRLPALHSRMWPESLDVDEESPPLHYFESDISTHSLFNCNSGLRDIQESQGKRGQYVQVDTSSERTYIDIRSNNEQIRIYSFHSDDNPHVLVYYEMRFGFLPKIVYDEGGGMFFPLAYKQELAKYLMDVFCRGPINGWTGLYQFITPTEMNFFNKATTVSLRSDLLLKDLSDESMGRVPSLRKMVEMTLSDHTKNALYKGKQPFSRLRRFKKQRDLNFSDKRNFFYIDESRFDSDTGDPTGADDQGEGSDEEIEEIDRSVLVQVGGYRF